MSCRIITAPGSRRWCAVTLPELHCTGNCGVTFYSLSVQKCHYFLSYLFDFEFQMNFVHQSVSLECCRSCCNMNFFVIFWSYPIKVAPYIGVIQLYLNDIYMTLVFVKFVPSIPLFCTGPGYTLRYVRINVGVRLVPRWFQILFGPDNTSLPWLKSRLQSGNGIHNYVLTPVPVSSYT